jgi:hypothetical protein
LLHIPTESSRELIARACRSDSGDRDEHPHPRQEATPRQRRRQPHTVAPAHQQHY